MNALRAEKSLFSPEIVPVRTRSRDTALASAVETPEHLVIHEQVADPMVYRAASELIRLDDEGRKTDIEAQGQVYDVLQSVAEGLKEVGASHLAAAQILGTLADYVSGLGADFARQAKAKPLYARVMVTDREPEDIPECKLQSVTCIDGQRVQGDDAGKMSMTLTLYGTSNAMSQGMSMNRVFESGKKKWLLVYYGTVEGSDLNKFDTVDADLATLVQAVGAGGSAAMEEIRQAIEQGTLPPEIMKLVGAIADLNRALEAAKTPGALENPERTIAELKALLAEAAKAVPDLGALPPELIRAAALAEPAQIMNDLSLIAGGKIEAVLKDENVAPEIKERLREIVGAMQSAIENKDFSKFAQVMIGMHEVMNDPALPQSLADSAFNARVVSVLAAVTPEVMRSLPPDLQQSLLEMQRGIFAASAREAVLSQQMIALGHDKRHALQDLIESSGLSETERRKLIRELQSGQASVEILRHIVNRVEATMPGLDMNGIRADVGGLVRRAEQDMNTRTYTVAIDPVVRERVLPALAQLPLPQPMLREAAAGYPVTKPVLAAVIVASGEKRSPEVNYYIKEATKQIAKEQAKPIVELHKKYPIPGMTQRDLKDLKEGNFISAARMKNILENPQLPLPVRRNLEAYQAVQNQLAPYVSPTTIQLKLLQIQQVLIGTNPLMAKSVETFRQRNPDATVEDVRAYVAAMPERTRAYFDKAADYVSRHSGEQGFAAENPAEVIRILRQASFEAAPHEKYYFEETIYRVQMGEPIMKPDMDRLVDLPGFDIHDQVFFSENIRPIDKEDDFLRICGPGCGGDCDACRNGFVVALKKEGPNSGAMADIESSGYRLGHHI